MGIVQRKYSFLVALLAAIIVTGCTIQLAPSYDKELVSGLDAGNEEALTLFASLSGGSDQSKYPEYKERYSKVIGKFTALKLRAQTRQVPPLAKQLKKINFVSNLCDVRNDAVSCVNTSPEAIDQVVMQLKQMQKTHQESGLAEDLVVGFETNFITALQQALFVERALER